MQEGAGQEASMILGVKANFSDPVTSRLHHTLAHTRSVSRSEEVSPCVRTFFSVVFLFVLTNKTNTFTSVSADVKSNRRDLMVQDPAFLLLLGYLFICVWVPGENV